MLCLLLLFVTIACYHASGARPSLLALNYVVVYRVYVCMYVYIYICIHTHCAIITALFVCDNHVVITVCNNIHYEKQ